MPFVAGQSNFLCWVLEQIQHLSFWSPKTGWSYLQAFPNLQPASLPQNLQGELVEVVGGLPFPNCVCIAFTFAVAVVPDVVDEVPDSVKVSASAKSTCEYRRTVSASGFSSTPNCALDEAIRNAAWPSIFPRAIADDSNA